MGKETKRGDWRMGPKKKTIKGGRKRTNDKIGKREIWDKKGNRILIYRRKKWTESRRTKDFKLNKI